jgi:hypothetical protein
MWSGIPNRLAGPPVAQMPLSKIPVVYPLRHETAERYSSIRTGDMARG